MAVQKNNNRKTDKDTAPKKPIGVIFWLAFFILIIGLFLFNRDRIKQTLENTQILTHLSLPSEKSKDPVKSPEEKNPPAVTKTETKPAASARETPAPVKPADKPPAPPEKPAASTPALQPAAPATSPASQPQAGRQSTTPVPAKPATPQSTPSAQPASPAPTASGNSRPAAGDRERTIYFTQVDSAGTILRTKVTRRIPASDSPMVDSLQALLGGPNAEEQRRGMVSLIPAGIKILNATVRGNTAYISFSEEFQYNTYGVEGYAAQLKQIIWTATEFSNVKDVQILIEGNRVDYLGEGIWIGSPLGRESFD